jgi:hypothetical protein
MTTRARSTSYFSWIYERDCMQNPSTKASEYKFEDNAWWKKKQFLVDPAEDIKMYKQREICLEMCLMSFLIGTAQQLVGEEDRERRRGNPRCRGGMQGTRGMRRKRREKRGDEVRHGLSAGSNPLFFFHFVVVPLQCSHDQWVEVGASPSVMVFKETNLHAPQRERPKIEKNEKLWVLRTTDEHHVQAYSIMINTTKFIQSANTTTSVRMGRCDCRIILSHFHLDLSAGLWGFVSVRILEYMCTDKLKQKPLKDKHSVSLFKET